MMLGPNDPERSAVQDEQDSDYSEEMHIFEIANMEFEVDEKSNTEKPSTEKPAPTPSLKDFVMGEDSINVETQTQTQVDVVSSSPEESSNEFFEEALNSMMDEFNLDLCSVTHALLKNSGEVGSTRHFLRTGVRPDGYPIWQYKDDLDLQKNDSGSLTLLAEKYGMDNLTRRLDFLAN